MDEFGSVTIQELAYDRELWYSRDETELLTTRGSAGLSSVVQNT
jgi:hypothetical protein